MKSKLHSKQNKLFLARVELIKNHISENRGREVINSELMEKFELTYAAVKSACDNIESNGFITHVTRPNKRNRVRYYKWVDNKDLLNTFMAGGVNRSTGRECAG